MAARVAPHIAPRWLIIGGGLLVLGAMLYGSTLNRTIPYFPDLVVPIVVGGFGIGVISVILPLCAVAEVGPREIGPVSAITLMVYNLGGPLVLVVIQAVQTSRTLYLGGTTGPGRGHDACAARRAGPRLHLLAAVGGRASRCWSASPRSGSASRHARSPPRSTPARRWRPASCSIRPHQLRLTAVITRMSELFLRTLRDDPADAEVPSHKLLIRAGYVRPVGPGLYSWLPLGLRVLRKIERIVREEMNAIGGQEILFPALLPRAPYETTNRWTEYGDGVFRLKDRRGNDYLLGPTHEELFTLTVKGEYSSYKDFPLLLYQIQTKYRDEARPRAGILRGREFVMKDSYSFDVDDDGLKAAYHAHREAYQRIFERLAVRYVIVSAVSGAMGGSASEEFLAESEVGEDTFVRCLESGYAANVEAVITAVPESLPIDGLPEAEVHDTPDTPTIATLVDWANGADLGRTDHRRGHAEERAAQGPPARRRVGAAGGRRARRPRGRRQAAGRRARSGRVRAARRRRLRQATRSWSKGYIGPKALLANGVRYLVDPRVVDGTSWITGADAPGKHVVGLVAGRDFIAGRHHRGRRGARRRPVTRRGGPAGERRAGSRSATSSSSAASTPTRSPPTCSARTASRCG